MTEKLNSADELEELSLLLDEINAGRQPECDNPETAELLAVAALIKNSGGPVCPPQHLLDQTVDRALAGIQAGKKKPSKVWWYSGALGTAAAVLLVVGLNLLPSWTKQVPPVIPPQPAASQQQETPQPKPSNEPSLVSQTTPAEQPKLAAPVTEKQVPASEPPRPGLTLAQIPPPELSKLPDTPKIMTEQAPRTNQSKSAYSSFSSLPAAAKSSSPAITPLTIPGQVPDLVITDRENGSLRQVYYKGTPQELTITQRLHPQNAGTIQPTTKAPALPENLDEQPNPINTVQITIADQEVTLEGRQPREELMKLAQSLTP